MNKFGLGIAVAFLLSAPAFAEKTEFPGIVIDVAGLTSGVSSEAVLEWWEQNGDGIALEPHSDSVSTYSKGEVLRGDNYQWALASPTTMTSKDVMTRAWFSFTGPNSGGELVQFSRKTEYSDRLTAPKLADTVTAILGKYGTPSNSIDMSNFSSYDFAIKDGAVVECKCTAQGQPYATDKLDEIANAGIQIDYVLSVTITKNFDDRELVREITFAATDYKMLRESAAIEVQALLDRQEAVLSTAKPSTVSF